MKTPLFSYTKPIFFLFILLFYVKGWGQIVTYTPTSTTGANATNSTSTSLTRGIGISSSSSCTGSWYQATHYDVTTDDYAAAVTANNFWEFSVTPSASYQLNLTQVSVSGLRASSTGPQSHTWAYRIGSGAWQYFTTSGSSGSGTCAITGNTYTWDFTDFTSTQTVTFRLISSSAGSTGGTFRMGTIILGGTVSAACAAPTVSSTISTSNLTTTAVDLSGSATDLGGGTQITAVGFQYSVNADMSSPAASTQTGLTVTSVPYTISRSLSSLPSNTRYYYRALAVNNCSTPQTGYSHTSSYPQFTTISLAPTAGDATAIASDRFTANWAAPTGQGSAAFTYQLQIDNDADFSSTIYDDAALTGTSLVQTGLSPSTTYYYRVRIVNAGGNSAWSNVKTLTTSAPSPEINVRVSTTNYLSGSTYGFGNQVSGINSAATTFTIENLGTAALNVSSIALSGTNADQFEIVTNPAPINVGTAPTNTTAFTVRFSPTSTGAKTATLTIDNNDADEGSYTIVLTGTGTSNNSSDIVVKSGYSYPQNIPYASYQATNITGGSNDIEVAQFTIRDGGATTDTDNLATTLYQLTLTLTNSANIRRIAIYDGATEIAEQAGAASVVFTGLNLVAPDNGTKDFSIRVSFNSTVTDNQTIRFQIAATTSALPTGSTFAATHAGAAVTSNSGDDNRIEVSADRLAFVQQPPANVGTNAAMSPAVTVSANDVNGNRDLDFTGAGNTVSITSTGTLSVSPITVNATNGLATFNNIIHTATATARVLTAARSGFTSATSNSFNVVYASQPTDYFRSRGTVGNWNAASSWETSPTGLPGTWNNATLFPEVNASDVTILAGHKIVLNTASATLTNTHVLGTLEVTTNGAYSVSGDDDIELFIENGGVFLVNSPGVFDVPGGNASGLVKTGGKLVAGPSLGSGSQFVNAYAGKYSGLFYFGNGGICEWANGTTTLGSSTPEDSEYLNPYAAEDIPIFRVTTSPAYEFGSNVNDNVFHAVLEVVSPAIFTVGKNAKKTFKYGIRGDGILFQNSTSGDIILGTLTIEPEIGGTVTIKIQDYKLKLPKGGLVPVGANVKVESVSNTQNHRIHRQGGILAVNGTLDISNLQLTNSATGSTSVLGVLRTSNTNGLVETGGAIPGGTLTLNNGSTIDYYAPSGNQIISTSPRYKKIIFSGGGTKKPSSSSNVEATEHVTITGTPTVDFSRSNLGASIGSNSTKFTMDGGRLILGMPGNNNLNPIMDGEYNLTGGTIEFTRTTLPTTLSADRIRTPKTYHNIEITGSSTITYAGGNLTLQPNANILVKNGSALVGANGSSSIVGSTNSSLTLENNATFKTASEAGFYGAASTFPDPSPSVRNNVTLNLNAGSTIEYARETGILPASSTDPGHQVITALATGYPNLKISGSGEKIPNAKSLIVNNTTIVAGGTLKIPETAEADAPYVLTAKKGIQVAATATALFQNNAQLMQDETGVSNTGSITTERKVTDMDNNFGVQTDYVYWSAPVSGQNIRDFSPATPWNFRLQYNETTDFFVPTLDSDFTAGKGYALRAETLSSCIGCTTSTNPANNAYDKTYRFKGTPNNAVQNIVIKRTNAGTTGSGIGYNLVGNPYPSNISFDALYDLNYALIYKTAWFWTNGTNTTNQQGSSYAGNNYAVYNATGGNSANYTNTNGTTAPDGIIKVGQGFIIQKKGQGAETLQFKNKNGAADVRVTTAGSFYQKSGETKNRYWLKLVSPSDVANTQLIGYVDGASDGFEQDYDAEIFELNSDIFYSFLGDKKLLIQGKAKNFSDTDVIPVGANFSQTGQYTIALNEAEGIFAESQPIYIHDKSLNIYKNLQEGAYHFNTNAGQSQNRFEIVYLDKTILGTGEMAQNDFLIFRDGQDAVLKSKNILGNIEIYDASGRLVKSAKFNTKEAKINMSDLAQGFYIFKIENSGNVKTKKWLH